MDEKASLAIDRPSGLTRLAHVMMELHDGLRETYHCCDRCGRRRALVPIVGPEPLVLCPECAADDRLNRDIARTRARADAMRG
jgi:hypothetical protein